MDADVFKLFAGFVVKGRRLLGPVDSDKLLHDREYARDIFRKVDEEGDEELVLLCLQLRERLGLLAADGEKTQPRDKTDPPTGKYVHGLRS